MFIYIVLNVCLCQSYVYFVVAIIVVVVVRGKTPLVFNTSDCSGPKNAQYLVLRVIDIGGIPPL